MDIEIHNINTLKNVQEKFDKLGHSSNSDFHKIREFIDKKIGSIQSHFNTLKNRVSEAERRLENANIALHIARNSYDLDKDGKKIPKNTRAEERKVAQCQAGLNAAIKNLQLYEEPYRYANDLVESYSTIYNQLEFNFCKYPQNYCQSIHRLIELFNSYVAYSEQKI